MNWAILPAVFVAKATGRIAHLSDDETFFVGDDLSNRGFGYYWWQADMKASNKSYFSTAAQGGGDQSIILIDELDLIVVATAHDREDRAMQLTAERILPAFIK